MSTYAELLRDPRWQKRRLEVLQRDNFTCQECGNREDELHVHHRHYKSGAKPWEYEDDELVTFCTDCHDKATDLIRKAKPGPGQFETLTEFLQGLELIIEEGVMPDESDATPEKVMEWMHDQWKNVGSLWRRVLFAGQVAIDNACDPNADTLEWKPEIAAALAVEHIKAVAKGGE